MTDFKISDDLVLLGASTFGAAKDAQMHRGDAADIIEQRRGTNPQEWRLYDRFVSHSDYDRLAVYIGGGPPLKTIEFVAETSLGTQGINIDIEALPGGSSDGRVRLITGSTAFLVEPSRFAMNKVFNISTAGTSSMTVNGFISSLGFGFAPGIAINIGDTFGSNRDSHSINMVGSGDGGNRATWKTFVEVIDGTANSLWTLQNDLNGGGFGTSFSITNDGGFNFPGIGPHSIGTSPPHDHRQLRLAGNFVSGGQGTSASNFHMETDLTGFSGDTLFLAGFAYQGAITTQAVAEVITDVASVLIDEPAITLGGGSSITRASTLNITGHPTEGAENFALIAQGPVEIADTSTRALTISQNAFGAEIFFVDTNNDEVRLPTGSLFALSGTIGAAAFTVTSLIQWTNANAPRINNVASTATVPPILPNRANTTTGIGGVSGKISLIAGSTEILRVSTTATDIWQVLITGAFTSGGSSNEAAKFRIEGALTGASGDTSGLFGAYFDSTITTQAVAEVVADVAQVRIDEPTITLGAGSSITSAQSLFITGAPTEGVRNYALLVDDAVGPDALVRIGRSSNDGLKLLISGAGGGGNQFDQNAQVRLSSIFVSDGSQDFATLLHTDATLLGVAGDTDHLSGVFLNARLTTQAATEDITNMSQLRIDAPVLTTNLTGNIINAQTLLIEGEPTGAASTNRYALRVAAGATLLGGTLAVGGNLTVSGAGPHAIAGTPSGIIGLIISDTFTSDGSSTLASGVFITQTLVGASGDTTSLTGTTFISAITTQTETESIANISQVEINEPFITDNLTGDITNAQTLLIVSSPTEGEANYSLRSAGTAPTLFLGLQFVVGTGNVVDRIQFLLAGNFTSGGGSTDAQVLTLNGQLTGASGDTGFLAGAYFTSSIVTQTATESITDITQVRIDEPTITDNLTGDITIAQTLLLTGSPTEGLSNFTLRSTGLAPTMFQGLQFVIGPGPTPAADFRQVLITGAFTSGGGATEATKFRVEGRLTGASGDITRLTGAEFGAGVTTQAVAEVVASVSQVHIEEPSIILGAGSSITNAQTLLVVSAPTEGVNNYALRVAAGATLLGGEFEHTGSTFGIFSTTPTTQPAAYTRNAVVVEDRTLLASASATTLNNNNVLAALIADLQSLGIIG